MYLLFVFVPSRIVCTLRMYEYTRIHKYIHNTYTHTHIHTYKCHTHTHNILYIYNTYIMHIITETRHYTNNIFRASCSISSFFLPHLSLWRSALRSLLRCCYCRCFFPLFRCLLNRSAFLSTPSRERLLLCLFRGDAGPSSHLPSDPRGNPQSALPALLHTSTQAGATSGPLLLAASQP